MIMRKKLALTPPMGWNSWDCYGASVTEEELEEMPYIWLKI